MRRPGASKGAAGGVGADAFGEEASMTGKELLLVLAGTAVAAGGAGVIAALVANGAADDGSDRDARILARLDEIGRSLDGTERALEESREAVGQLRDRIAAVELRTVGRPGRVDRRAATEGEPEEAASEDGAFRVSSEDGGMPTFRLDGETGRAVRRATTESLGEMVKQLEDQVVLSGAIATPDGTTIQLGEAFKGLAESFRLRRLPEEERWEKAREELGLTQNQVDEIQAATAARDEALDGALTVERSETGEGAHITVKNLDPAKAKAANDEYRRRVDNALNDEQKKGWHDKGYDRAFGKRGMGMTGSVISVSTTRSVESSEADSE